MSLEYGVDYVFCPKSTYVGSAGIGDGCLVGTKRLVLVVPLKIETVVWNRSITTTTFQLGNEPVNTGIGRVLTQPEATLGELEQLMSTIHSDLTGAVLHDVGHYARVRVRAGWFSRGIYFSEKEKGPGWKGYPLKGKEMAQHWVAFYQGMDNFVA